MRYNTTGAQHHGDAHNTLGPGIQYFQRSSRVDLKSIVKLYRFDSSRSLVDSRNRHQYVGHMQHQMIIDQRSTRVEAIKFDDRLQIDSSRSRVNCRPPKCLPPTGSARPDFEGSKQSVVDGTVPLWGHPPQHQFCSSMRNEWVLCHCYRDSKPWRND